MKTVSHSDLFLVLPPATEGLRVPVTIQPKSGGCAWMQSATALAGWACTKMKVHPVGELRLLGKSRRLNELRFCATLNCRF